MLSRSQLIFRYEPESLAVFANMAAKPSDTRRRVINRLVRDLKIAGIWPKMDCLYLLACHDSVAALLNWKTPGAFTLTAVNSPTFTADRGYISDGTTSYLSTGFTPSTNAVAMLQDSVHVAARSLTAGVTNTNNTRIVGNATPAVARTLLQTTNGTNMQLSFSTTAGTTAANTASDGFFCGVRSASNALQLYRNGASLGTGTTASTAIGASDIQILRDTINQGCLLTAAFVSFGAQLSAAEVAALSAAELTYMQAVGAA